jgi:alkanesulfonate monooxygenase SsuD/methylene tetrahydromethanopterin reductase-like flavin-dependent oxidoreductase (luciferase family)
MEFGLYLPCYYPEHDKRSMRDHYREAIEQAELAEELGFSSVTIPEHHFVDYITVPSPLILAAAVAQRTSKVKIISSVLVLPFYDIRRLAGEITQTDHITGGRLELGLGRGAFAWEFTQFKVPMSESKPRFYESLELLRRLLTETDVTFEGDYYNLEAPMTVMPRPYTDPYPRFWIASVTEDGMRWALEHGYAVQSTPLRKPWEASIGLAELFTRLRDEIDPDSGAKHHMLRNTYISKDRADLDAKSLALLDNDQRFKTLYETPGDVRKGRTQRYEPADLTPDQAAANVIFGDPERVLTQVQAYEDAGVDGLQLNMTFGMSHEDILTAMRLFADEVMPNVKASVPAA